MEITIKPKVVKVVEPANVTLVLSFKEAIMLKRIVGAISGGGEYRAFTNEIWRALERLDPSWEYQVFVNDPKFIDNAKVTVKE